MEIVVGKRAGFCYGVNEAVTKADEVISKNKSDKVYCLGELVHNKQVIKNLEKKGLVFINCIDELEDKFKKIDVKENETDSIERGKELNGNNMEVEQLEKNKLNENDIRKNNENKEEKTRLIIRAHGIEKSIYEEANKKNIELFDYTCPNVLAIHKIVEDYVNKGYYIIIIGGKKHPETIGTVSFANGKGFVIEKEDEITETVDLIINKLKSESANKVFICVQTTFNLEKFNKYVQIINEKINKTDKTIEIEVRNTICDATKLRQEETEEISSNVDYMIVIGGKNSSNSTKLYEISKNNCANTLFIETYKELEDKLEEIRKSNRVGIMAGASTPSQSIKEIIDLLNS